VWIYTKNAWKPYQSLAPRIEAFALSISQERATQKPHADM